MSDVLVGVRAAHCGRLAVWCWTIQAKTVGGWVDYVKVYKKREISSTWVGRQCCVGGKTLMIMGGKEETLGEEDACEGRRHWGRRIHVKEGDMGGDIRDTGRRIRRIREGWRMEDMRRICVEERYMEDMCGGWRRMEEWRIHDTWRIHWEEDMEDAWRRYMIREGGYMIRDGGCVRSGMIVEDTSEEEDTWRRMRMRRIRRIRVGGDTGGYMEDMGGYVEIMDMWREDMEDMMWGGRTCGEEDVTCGGGYRKGETRDCMTMMVNEGNMMETMMDKRRRTSDEGNKEENEGGP
ncbi:hypothetical protein Hamer_G009425 [Homarus americanus]|uniref:Uncharacterized protein n=1 Tax=Homarus americanus TaxID=6706 RepID=A0A8J5JA66_HOMAM|nr:hypothetical protein Hamer_G009425 [Homarus americanus]